MVLNRAENMLLLCSLAHLTVMSVNQVKSIIGGLISVGYPNPFLWKFGQDKHCNWEGWEYVHEVFFLHSLLFAMTS